GGAQAGDLLARPIPGPARPRLHREDPEVGIRGLPLLFGALSFLSQGAPLPAREDPTPDAAQWREDLRVMAREMPRRHKNLFHTMTRERFEAAVRNLDERIPSLSRHQV